MTKLITLILTFLTLNTFAQASLNQTSLVRYEYVPVLKKALVERAIAISDRSSSSAYDYIKLISDQAIINVRENRTHSELIECVSDIKFNLEQSNIYLSNQEIVESLIAAINS